MRKLESGGLAPHAAPPGGNRTRLLGSPPEAPTEAAARRIEREPGRGHAQRRERRERPKGPRGGVAWPLGAMSPRTDWRDSDDPRLGLSLESNFTPTAELQSMAHETRTRDLGTGLRFSLGGRTEAQRLGTFSRAERDPVGLI
jgi:hypothetical protein